MNDARKTLTIPASELRVGDHIINVGTVLFVGPDKAGCCIDVQTDGNGRDWCPTFHAKKILTIERHEPEVVVRYFADRPEDGFASLDEIERGPGWAVTKFTWHDGVLHAVEIVGASDEGDGR